ncbi:DUF2179 domain-containing protein [Mycoplasmopsis columbinasalis]|uniref:Uncharacterized BCR, YitT family COG1284 n=1 Tax=Mycoplasmopsis columbinasalis TaxID=114880 RepID=A0A449BB37_9BACT|nr:DUF2179 domain-containing protein [Mycoplasmopsis columbinasalis]VEU78401.1 Uncharacterized BCR, YitT family COG1284 [Mycoplasmopsis columbinasalis]
MIQNLNNDESVPKNVTTDSTSKNTSDAPRREYQDNSLPEYDIFAKEGENDVKEIIRKTNTKYRYTKMSNFVLRFSRFYAPMPISKIVVFTAVFAVIFGIIGILFVKNPGIYNFGAAAIGQALSKIVNVLLRTNQGVNSTIYNIIDHSLFWILYLIISFPIFWFGFKKVGKNFTWITLEFLIISSLVSFMLGQIPALNNFYLMGNFSTSSISAEGKTLIANQLWAGKEQIWNLVPLEWTDGGNIIAQIIFAIVYGVMLAFFFAVVAIMGGSAGVTGIVGEYYSTVKQKSFGTVNAYINLVIMTISVFIGTFLAGSIILQDLAGRVNSIQGLSSSDLETIKKITQYKWLSQMYFSPNMISTLICNFVLAAVLNKLFPKFKIVQVKIYSPHMSAIRQAIITDKKTVNSFTISKGIGGYSGNQMRVLTCITLYKQVPRLIKLIRKVDENNALITINNIASVDGNLYLPETKF